MNTVVQLFPDNRQGEPPVREVRVADCDNGYLRIANELYDAILITDLTARQVKVVMAIMRKTYGFNKKFDRISDSQIAEVTGIHRTHVCNAKLSLIDRKILIKEGSKIGVNKVFSEWKTQENQNGYSVAKPATNNVAKMATVDVADPVHTKDNIKTKDNKILKYITSPAEKPASTPVAKKPKPTPAELDFSSWPNKPSEHVLADWLITRNKKKSPLTQTAVNRLSKQLHAAAEHGFSVDDCISECVVRGWTAFELGWLMKDRTNNQRQQPIRQNGFTHTGEPSCTVGKI